MYSKINSLNINAFRALLKILLLTHLVLLIKWKYYIYDSTSFFRYPIIDMLDFGSPTIHYLIFSIFTVSILMFCTNIKASISLILVSFSFFYFIFSDLFLFHHDIFLAANITLLSGLLIRSKKKENQRVIVLAFKILLTVVLFFSFFHKLNDSFYKGLLIEKLIEQNTLFAHFFNLKNNDFITKISPIIAKMTVLFEGVIPLLLWTRYRFIGAAIGCVLHFGISFFSGMGAMFNLYLPLLYLFFIPLQQIELPVNKLNKKLKLLDFYGGILLVKGKKSNTLKERFKLYLKFLPTNIFFLILMILYIFVTTRMIYNLLFIQ